MKAGTEFHIADEVPTRCCCAPMCCSWLWKNHSEVLTTFVFCFFLSKVGTDESQESSMTDADDTQLHAVESDEF